MDVKYNGEHSITIGTKNSWSDWHLIPSRKLVIPMPNPVMNMIQIPGRNGSVDLSEFLAGRTMFQDRQGTLEFEVAPGYKSWEEAYSEIANYIHGRRYNAILDDDPYYYYEGRFSLNQWASNPNWDRIVINYVVSPYKRRVAYAGDDWEWDTFRFGAPGYTGNEADDSSTPTEQMTKGGDLLTIYDGVRVPATIPVKGYGMPVVPTISCTTDSIKATMTSSDGTTKIGPISLKYGNNVIPEFAVATGYSMFSFTGNGVVSVHYRGGSL